MLYTTTPTSATLELTGTSSEFRELSLALLVLAEHDDTEDVLNMQEREQLDGLLVSVEAVNA